MKVKVKKAKKGMPWIENEFVQELDGMNDCYLQNYPPLDLSNYKNDRNLEFYRLQNELLLSFNKTGKSDEHILWQMFPYIEGVVQSIAKKKVCIGCVVPDFDGKSLEATLRIMNHYKKFPYFRAGKLENVVYHKVVEVFLDHNLQINERTCDYEALENYENELGKYDQDIEGE